MDPKSVQSLTTNQARLALDLQKDTHFREEGSDFDFSDQNTGSETHVPPSVSFRENCHFERDIGQTDRRTD